MKTRFRFSLRLLLIVFTIVAVVFGGMAHFYFGEAASFAKHQAAIDELGRKGVLVETFRLAQPRPELDQWKHRFARKWINERAYPETGRVRLDYSAGASPQLSAAEALDLLGQVQTLREVELSHLKLTRPVVEKIGALPQLEFLVLECEGAEAGAAEKIHTWKGLKQFWYRGHLGDAELHEIFKLPSLEEVQIEGEQLSDAALRSLGQSKSVQGILFIRMQIDSDLLGALAPVAQLKHVVLHTSRFMPEASEGLAKLKQLRGLELFMVEELPSELCSTLAKLENLEVFSVRGGRSFTSQQVAYLVKCRRLRRLSLSQTTLLTDDFALFNDHPFLQEIEYAGKPDEASIMSFLQAKSERSVRVVWEEDGWEGCSYTLQNGKLVRSPFSEGWK